jgi:hypothetical protein
VERLKIILARKFGPLTGLQWLLIAAAVGAVLYVVWRRRLEAEEAAIETGEVGPFEEGTVGDAEAFRGASSELPFVGAGDIGYTAPAPYEGLTAEEQLGFFDALQGRFDELADLLAAPVEEPIEEPGEMPSGQLPPWQERIRGLKGKNVTATRRIHKLQRGGVTKNERQRVQKIRQGRQRRRQRIQSIRQRHAGSVRK